MYYVLLFGMAVAFFFFSFMFFFIVVICEHILHKKKAD